MILEAENNELINLFKDKGAKIFSQEQLDYFLSSVRDVNIF